MNDLQILHNNIDNRSVSKAADTITKIATKELLLSEELFDPHEDSRIGENRSANNVAFAGPLQGGGPKIELPDYIPADANLLEIYQSTLAPEPTGHVQAPAQVGLTNPYTISNYSANGSYLAIYDKNENKGVDALLGQSKKGIGSLFTWVLSTNQTYDSNTDHGYRVVTNSEDPDNTVVGYFCVTFYPIYD